MPAILIRNDPNGLKLRGAAHKLWWYTGPEAIISGPAETGKTLPSLVKVDTFLRNHPGSQGVVCRKVRDSLHGTALTTFDKKVRGRDVIPYGGKRAQWYDYGNGSRLWIAGLDKPGKALSSERDIIYVNQAEELTVEDWETLLTRTTGRAGNAPWSQLIGDCNPGPPHHWIKRRKTLKLWHSRHRDNPSLYDDAGRITEQGEKTMRVLRSLTGVRRQRLLHGRWVSAEGAVYNFDPAVHLIDAAELPDFVAVFCAIDFGYSHPFVCQWWGVDHDGRLYLYREIYHSFRTILEHANRIKAINGASGDRPECYVCDHDLSDRATLEENGIPTIPAIKDRPIRNGISKVEDRLKVVDGDGLPRLFVVRGACIETDPRLEENKLPTCTEQEFDSYQYPKAGGRLVKDVPVDKDNHGMDALRYGVRYAELRGSGDWTPTELPAQDRSFGGELPGSFLGGSFQGM